MGSGTLKGAAWLARAALIRSGGFQPRSAAEPPSALSFKRSRRRSMVASSVEGCSTGLSRVRQRATQRKISRSVEAPSTFGPHHFKLAHHHVLGVLEHVAMKHV